MQLLLGLLRVGIWGQCRDDEVAVCAVAPDGDAVLLQGFAQGTRIGDDLLPVEAEGRLGSLAQRDGKGCEAVLVQGGMTVVDDGALNRLGQFFLAEDDGAFRALQRVIRREGHDVGVSNGRRHEACGNEADVLADVDPEQRAGLVRDFREALRVDGERETRRRENHDLGLVACNLLVEFLPVDVAVLPVCSEDGEAVGEAVAELLFAAIEGEDGIAGFQERLEDDTRGGADAVEAYDGVFRMEALERALDRHALKAPSAADAVVIRADVGEDAALEVGGKR